MLHWRARDVARIQQALHRTQADHGELMVVESLPGLGRTTLAAAAAEHAAAVGLTTLAARGSHAERGFSHGVVLQLFERAVQERNPKERRHLLRGPAAVTRALLDPGASRRAAETDPFRLAHGLYWVVAHLAQRNPVALVVDDVHLVDAPSLLFLSHVAERLDGLGCTMVLTAVASSDQDPDVEALVHHPRSQVIRLEPVPTDQLAEHLCEEAPPRAPPSICRTVAELSAGSPALADHLLASVPEVADQPEAAAVRHLRGFVDEWICEALKRSVDCLDPSARRLAIAAAFLEGDAQLGAVAQVADLSVEEATRAARCVVDAGLAAGVDPLELTSPTASAALRALVPSADAAALSRRAADALGRQGRCPGVLARHLLRTAPSGDESVVARLWPAADQALGAGDPGAAIAFLRRTLQEPAPTDVRPDLLLDLGRAEAQLGDPVALTHLEEAAATLHDRNQRAQALLTAGRLQADLGHPSEAVGTLRRGLALHPDEGLRDELTAQVVAAALLDLHHRPRRAEWAPTAPATGELQDAAARALLAHLALDHVLRGEELDLAEMWTRSLVPRLMAIDAAGEAEAVTATCGTFLWLGDPVAAASLIDDALPAVQRSGDLALISNLTARRAMVRSMAGDLAGAVLDGRTALDTGVGRLRTATQAAVASAHLATGDVEGARQVLPGPAEDDRWKTTPMAVLVAVVLGDISLAREEPHLALERYAWAAELAEHASLGNPLAVPHLDRRSGAHLRLGETHRARELAEESLDRAEAIGLPLAAARARLALARTTDKATAVELIEDALPVLDRVQVRVDLARAHLDLGDALLRTGHHHDGVKHLHEAEALAAECGARPLLQHARSHLRAAGARAGRRGDPRALTPSEQRVAELARTGRTNREIAGELYVSTKAVEWHLGNVYRKLDISGRRELKDLELAPDGQSEKFSQ